VAQWAAFALPAEHGYRSDLLVAVDTKSKNGSYLINQGMISVSEQIGVKTDGSPF
jgi:hypothetical protein